MSLSESDADVSQARHVPSSGIQPSTTRRKPAIMAMLIGKASNGPSRTATGETRWNCWITKGMVTSQTMSEVRAAHFN
jgi:hypothetical protein